MARASLMSVAGHGASSYFFMNDRLYGVFIWCISFKNTQLNQCFPNLILFMFSIKPLQYPGSKSAPSGPCPAGSAAAASPAGPLSLGKRKRLEDTDDAPRQRHKCERVGVFDPPLSPRRLQVLNQQLKAAWFPPVSIHKPADQAAVHAHQGAVDEQIYVDTAKTHAQAGENALTALEELKKNDELIAQMAVDIYGVHRHQELIKMAQQVWRAHGVCSGDFNAPSFIVYAPLVLAMNQLLQDSGHYLATLAASDPVLNPIFWILKVEGKTTEDIIDECIDQLKRKNSSADLLPAVSPLPPDFSESLTSVLTSSLLKDFLCSPYNFQETHKNPFSSYINCTSVLDNQGVDRRREVSQLIGQAYNFFSLSSSILRPHLPFGTIQQQGFMAFLHIQGEYMERYMFTDLAATPPNIRPENAKNPEQKALAERALLAAEFILFHHQNPNGEDILKYLKQLLGAVLGIGEVPQGAGTEVEDDVRLRTTQAWNAMTPQMLRDLFQRPACFVQLYPALKEEYAMPDFFRTTVTDSHGNIRNKEIKAGFDCIYRKASSDSKNGFAVRSKVVAATHRLYNQFAHDIYFDENENPSPPEYNYLADIYATAPQTINPNAIIAACELMLCPSTLNLLHSLMTHIKTA
jgi:hypothetical protein